MKKILLSLFLICIGLATASDVLAWHNRSYCGWYNRGCGGARRSSGYGWNRGCDYNRSNCYSQTNCCSTQSSCAPVCRVEENPPCGPAPLCTKTIQVPANLVKVIDYKWECPDNCCSSINTF